MNPVAERLSVACKHAETNKRYWKCIAPECKHFQVGNRQLSRIISHSMDCPHLSIELKELASQAAIEENALGAKVNPKEIQADTQDEGAPYKKAKTLQKTLTNVAVTTGKARYQDEVNHALVHLFSVSGIPAAVLDSPQWKNFVDVATRGKCNPLSSTMLTVKLIPAEAALVRKLQTDFLRTCDNLTLTFDGGATRKPSSVYTVHITTAERETFFVEGRDATSERHTAEYIEGLICEVNIK